MKVFLVRYKGPFIAKSKNDAIAQMRKTLGSNVIAAIDVAECSREEIKNYNGEWEPLACYLDGTIA